MSTVSTSLQMAAHLLLSRASWGAVAINTGVNTHMSTTGMSLLALVGGCPLAAEGGLHQLQRVEW